MQRRPLALLIAAVLALVATGCEIRFLEVQGDAPLRYRDAVFADVDVTTDLVYGNAVNEQGVAQDLHLDLYQPVGDDVEARPAIVWVHGGSFRFGNKTSGELVDQATVFSQMGYVNVSIQYRLSSTGCSAAGATPECLQAIVNAKEDAQAAVRWLRANADLYDVDPERIAIGGTSAGAITALNVGWGPEAPGSSGNPGWPSDVEAAVSLSGSAFAVPNAGEADVLLFHGTADVVVPYAWAQTTITNGTNAGLIAELTAWEGDGHVPYAAHRTEIIDQTTNFLYHTMTLALAEQ